MCEKDFFSKVEKTLLEVIALNKENRDRLNEWEHYSPTNYLKEFCTVHLDIGRQVGKTTFITKHANENDAVVTFLNWRNDKGIKVFSSSEDIARLRSKKEHSYKNIFIDEPDFVFRRVAEYSEILEAFASKDYKNQTFILLGE